MKAKVDVMAQKNVDPYLILFPFGLASAVIGVSLWLAYSMNLISTYPRQIHANLMFFGFLWAFIAGFMMTAIPKMTQALPAQKSEKAMAVILLLLQWVFSLSQQFQLSGYLYLIQIIFLLYFLIKRLLKNRRIPFEGFVFMPFAFIFGIFGVIDFLFISQNYSILTLLSGQAMVINLIFGIGSRLIPVITRVPNATMPDQYKKISNFNKMLAFAVWLNISFLLEYMGYLSLALIIRALFVSIFSVTELKVLKKPAVISGLAIGIRSSLFFFVISYVLVAIFPIYKLPIEHLSFIAGLALFTMMVASRVTLAHGVGNTDLEISSKSIKVVVFAFIISAILRALALNNILSLTLMTSALLFLFAIVLWTVFMFKNLRITYK